MVGFAAYRPMTYTLSGGFQGYSTLISSAADNDLSAALYSYATNSYVSYQEKSAAGGTSSFSQAGILVPGSYALSAVGFGGTYGKLGFHAFNTGYGQTDVALSMAYAPISWGGGDGNWGNTSKWQYSVVPDSTTPVNFVTSGSYATTLSSNASCDSLTFTTGTVTLDMAGFNLTQHGVSERMSVLQNANVTVTNGGTLQLNGNRLSVGESATGTLTISGGSDVILTSGFTAVGSGGAGGGTGTINVTGPGSVLSSAQKIDIGGGGTGTINVRQGASVASTTWNIGASSTGAVNVQNSNSTLTATNIAVGGIVNTSGVGVGTLTIGDNASVTVSDTLTIWNDNSSVNLQGGTLRVGGLNTGNKPGRFNWTGGTLDIYGMPLNVQAGSTLGGDVTIGQGKKLEMSGAGYRLNIGLGASGSMTVVDGGSIRFSGERLTVGQGSTGSLSIRNGSTVNVTNGALTLIGGGGSGGGTGTLLVDGEGSAFTTAGTVAAGSFAKGIITVQNGGTVNSGTVLGSSITGYNWSSDATVKDAGSRWNVTGDWFVGDDGYGTGGNADKLTITNGGAVNVTGTMRVLGPGKINLTSGTLKSGALSLAGDANRLAWDSGTLELTGSTVTIGNTANTANTLGLNTVTLENGRTLSATNGYRVVVGQTASGTINVNAGGTLMSNYAVVIGEDKNGTVTATGADAKVIAGSYLVVGNHTGLTANLSLGDGASASSTVDTAVAQSSGSTGTITLGSATANTSTLTTPALYIGGHSGAAGGTGNVTLSAGGAATVSGTTKVWNTGTLKVTGGSLTTGLLDLGGVSSRLNWTGGTIDLTNSNLSVAAGSTDAFGATASLGANQFLRVSGTGKTITAGTGGTVSASSLTLAASVTAADQVGSTNYSNAGGTTTISGATSINSGTLALSAGTVRTGTLTNSGGTFSWTGGTLDITNGDIAFGSSAGALGNSYSLGGTHLLRVSGAGKTLSVNSGGSLAATSLTIGGTYTASDQIGATNFASGGGATTVSGATTINSGTLALSGGSLITESLVKNGGTVTWSSGTLELTNSDLTLATGGSPLGAGLDTSGGKLLRVSGASKSLTVGAGGSLATSNLTIGGTFTASDTVGATTFNQSAGATTVAGTTKINVGGSLNLSGGTLTTGSLESSGTPAVNFTAGTLQLTNGGVTIGSVGTLPAQTFGAGKTLIVSGATDLQSGGSLTLNGGSVTTGTLTGANGSNLVFNSGTLAITNGGLSVGASSVLGANSVIGNGKTLKVAQATTIEAGSTMSVSGGVFETGSLNLLGTLNLNSGTFRLTNSVLNLGAGGFAESRLYIGPDMTVEASLGSTVSSTARLTVDGGTYNAANLANSGRVSIIDSAATFTGASTNASAGVISVIDSTVTFGTGAGQFVNNGRLNLTNVIVNGDLKSPAGSTIDVGSNVVFNGNISGAGNFPGAGSVTFNGSYSPGDSPAVTTFGGNFTMGSSGSLLIELGGTAAGTGYDQINVGGTLARNGTLNVVLINGFVPTEGMTFDVLNWSAVSGSFSSINLPTLGDNLSWDTSQLSSSGVLSVQAVPEPTAMLLGTASMSLLMRGKRRQHAA